MNFPLTVIELAGRVALLLWGLHMVQSGIQRAFGPNLRQILASAIRNRFTAFLAGLGVTSLLQSSTATGLMITGFAATGLVDLVPALAVMLGANVGTTLIVQALSFDVESLAPALFLIGFLMFHRGGSSRARDLGRVAIGLGLMLMSLHQLLEFFTPYEDVPSLRLLLGAISTEPVLGLLLGTAMAWAAHSSVAVVLLVMSLAARGAVPLDAAFVLVLGANLGTAINPILEGAAGEDPMARRVPIGNALNRLVGCLIAMFALPLVGPALVKAIPDNAHSVAVFHTGFNLALAVLFFPFLNPYAALLRRLLPARVEAADPATPMYLQPSTREVPGVAIGAAAREALRLVDVLGAMLQNAREGLEKGDRRHIAEAKRMDDVIDKLNGAIKSFLSDLDPDAMTDADHQRIEEILIFAHNLEYAGDVVDKNLMGLASKRLKRGMAFSPQERAELARMLDRLVANLNAAAAVFMTEDVRAARLLAAEKEVFRDIETAATQSHFDRLRAGGSDLKRIGALHLDVLRDLKQVNAHLVAAAAYPVLKSKGELLASRLRIED